MPNAATSPVSVAPRPIKASARSLTRLSVCSFCCIVGSSDSHAAVRVRTSPARPASLNVSASFCTSSLDVPAASPRPTTPSTTGGSRPPVQSSSSPSSSTDASTSSTAPLESPIEDDIASMPAVRRPIARATAAPPGINFASPPRNPPTVSAALPIHSRSLANAATTPVIMSRAVAFNNFRNGSNLSVRSTTAATRAPGHVISNANAPANAPTLLDVPTRNAPKLVRIGISDPIDNDIAPTARITGPSAATNAPTARIVFLVGVESSAKAVAHPLSVAATDWTTGMNPSSARLSSLPNGASAVVA